jgi:hypothetical protein
MLPAPMGARKASRRPTLVSGGDLDLRLFFTEVV